MKKKTIGIIAVSVLGAAAIFCSAMFTHQYLDAKNSKAAFDDLTNLITEIDEPQKATEAEESSLSAEELAAAEAALAREKYAALFAQNNDFIGWIRIDGTNVNYPVMQTPNKPDFYLKRSFDKSYSDYGVPYIDEACMTGISNNLVIYGHHMNDGSIFFDWDNKGSSGPQDGQADHVGIVQKVENGIVYTIEGNSGDSCRVNQYPVGYYEILGYGVPNP